VDIAYLSSALKLIPYYSTSFDNRSVPRNDKADTRPTVIISLKRLNTHFPIDDGNRVVCLAGCGISSLADSISQWFPDRESHSILGSTFLNPTTAAGVAFGSGGVYVRKGPARTDRALYCKVTRNKWGENVVNIVNTLGIEGLEDEDFLNGSGETAVGALDVYATDIRQGYRRVMAKSSDSKHGRAKASDADYQNKVCECTNAVSRYNADTSGEDCNRSEGKVLILATVSTARC
jgi:D-lactate dehydrogenase